MSPGWTVETRSIGRGTSLERDMGFQGFLLLLQHHPHDDAKPFYPAAATASLPTPWLFNGEHFQEQEALLRRRSLSPTETLAQLGMQRFS